MNHTAMEATPEQLARIATFEARVRRVFLEVAGIAEEILALKEAGLETREAAEAVADVHGDALDELRTLRISRGHPAFSEWWFTRVQVLRRIPDDMAIDELPLYLATLKVEQAIAQADSQLIDLLDRVADRPLGPIDAGQLKVVAGMIETEIQDRAEAVLTKLIESGWRP